MYVALQAIHNVALTARIDSLGEHLGTFLAHCYRLLVMNGQRIVIDPNYGFSLPLSKLTDHFMDTILNEEEVTCPFVVVKTEHPYMGRMAFPDEMNRPARTVVATQLGRETLVLGARVTADNLVVRAQALVVSSVRNPQIAMASRCSNVFADPFPAFYVFRIQRQ